MNSLRKALWIRPSIRSRFRVSMRKGLAVDGTQEIGRCSDEVDNQDISNIEMRKLRMGESCPI